MAEHGHGSTGRRLAHRRSWPAADRGAGAFGVCLPDGVPARTLRKCIEAAVVGLAGVQVRIAPLLWRDPDSDHALALAAAEAFPGARSAILSAGDEPWRLALAALTEGTPVPPAVLAPGAVSELLRWRPRHEQRGLVVMFTGLSGSGKSTLAGALVAWLEANTDRTVTLLDGDVVRRLLSSGLGFDRAARDLNIRRIGYVASEIARHHGIAVCSPIAPFAATRAAGAGHGRAGGRVRSHPRGHAAGGVRATRPQGSVMPARGRARSKTSPGSAHPMRPPATPTSPWTRPSRA